MAKGVVFTFHNETDADLFERIILALKKRYRIVSAEELEKLLLEKKPLNDVCHISFDDGERSFYEVVFPLLKKHNIHVSLFLSPEIISFNKNFWFQECSDYNNETMKKIISKRLEIPGERLRPFSFQQVFKALPFQKIKELIEAYQSETGCGIKQSMNMNAGQVREVDSSGLVSIGAHSVNHPILKNEDDDHCLKEINGSINGLQQMLGHPIKYFAYPNGRPGMDFSEREMRYLKDNNISLSFSTALDHLSADVNMLAIPRMGFPRMGLSPGNPLIYLRLGLGKKWIDARSIGKPSEQDVRMRILSVLNRN